MRSIQCKGCNYYDGGLIGCCKNQDNKLTEIRSYYTPIKYLKKCKLANNGKGGVDNRKNAVSKK